MGTFILCFVQLYSYTHSQILYNIFKDLAHSSSAFSFSWSCTNNIGSTHYWLMLYIKAIHFFRISQVVTHLCCNTKGKQKSLSITNKAKLLYANAFFEFLPENVFVVRWSHQCRYGFTIQSVQTDSCHSDVLVWFMLLRSNETTRADSHIKTILLQQKLQFHRQQVFS